jgi:hypothetical protein
MQIFSRKVGGKSMECGSYCTFKILDRNVPSDRKDITTYIFIMVDWTCPLE